MCVSPPGVYDILGVLQSTPSMTYEHMTNVCGRYALQTTVWAICVSLRSYILLIHNYGSRIEFLISCTPYSLHNRVLLYYTVEYSEYILNTCMIFLEMCIIMIIGAVFVCIRIIGESYVHPDLNCHSRIGIYQTAIILALKCSSSNPYF